MMLYQIATEYSAKPTSFARFRAQSLMDQSSLAPATQPGELASVKGARFSQRREVCRLHGGKEAGAGILGKKRGDSCRPFFVCGPLADGTTISKSNIFHTSLHPFDEIGHPSRLCNSHNRLKLTGSLTVASGLVHESRGRPHHHPSGFSTRG